LRSQNEVVTVDMQSIFEGVIERAGYDSRIDYTQPVPLPALDLEDRNWVTELLAGMS